MAEAEQTTSGGIRMSNFTKAAVAFLAVALLTTGAWAGVKSWDQVYVSGSYASGSCA
jgi:cytochrome c-type biogenesis protein CcmH/NrfG